MPLPQAWIDELFRRLVLTYGAPFLKQYEGLKIEDVKSDWGDMLEGFQRFGKSIQHALQNLPPDRPPNALQFRAACRAAPTESQPLAIDAPAADPATVARNMAKLKAINLRAGEARGNAQAVIDTLELKMAQGIKLTGSQRHVLECCRRHVTPYAQAEAMQQFTPIPPESLPPGMRP